jgi:hypothetical protein
MSEVPLHVSSSPPSDMPSTPAALASPLASSEDSGFRVKGLKFRFESRMLRVVS